MADTLILELETRLEAASAPPIDPVMRVDALNELAWALRIDEVPRAHALAGEGRALAIEHGYTLGQARAARTMAMTIDSDGMTALFSLAEEAKRLFDEASDPSGRAASRDFLASIYEHIGELTVALELALDALSIAREIGDPIRQGYALSSVGGILAGSGEIDAGVERLEEALAIFEAAHDLAGVTAICTRLCKVLKLAGRSEDALKYAELCREVSETTENEWSYATALTVMAEIENDRGRPAEAERLYRAALDSLSTETIRNVMGAGVQVALGRLLIDQGALAEATHELNDALRRVEGDSVSIVTETAAHEALAELSEQQDELASAIVHLRRVQALREQISQREAHSKLAQVEARAAMEAAKKDAEIHKLRYVELHAMQSKLLEAEKMGLLNTLAAGAAHELNTPLGVLRSNAQLSATATERLLGLVEDDSAQVAKLAAVLESCAQSTEQALERLSAVAHGLARFAQLDHAERRAFDVREGLESTLALLEPAIPETIEVERRFEDVPLIEGWPRQLNQAFMTVLENAVQAIDGAGVVSVETTATDGHVLVRVRDSGRGMSPEKAAHLFDMAWSEGGARTKMRMGLCAAHATASKHSGEIEVESTLGEGTTLTFVLPRLEAAT